MNRSSLINSVLIISLFVIAIATLFIIQSIYPIRSIPPQTGKNGGMQFDLDVSLPVVNDNSVFGSPDRAYDDLVKGVNLIKTSTGGHNVVITDVSTGYDNTSTGYEGTSGPDMPVYIFKGHFNDTYNTGPYIAYVVSPVYAFNGYWDNKGDNAAFIYVKAIKT